MPHIERARRWNPGDLGVRPNTWQVLVDLRIRVPACARAKNQHAVFHVISSTTEIPNGCLYPAPDTAR